MGRDILGTGRFLRLVVVDGWEWVERVRASAVVAVVAITDDRRLVLTAQRRRAVGDRVVIDLPAGLVGDEPGAEDEAIAGAGLRELAEETGWEAAAVETLATCPTSPGLTSEVVTLVRATGLRRTGAGGGIAGEDITVHTPLLDDLPAWLAAQVATGAVVDLKVYAGLALAR